MPEFMLPSWVPHTDCVLFDSNLLVVVIAGKTRPSLLSHGPAKDYTWNDYENLIEILSEFKTAVTTPQVLSEVNSLLNKTGYAREECRAVLAREIPLLEERMITGASVSTNAAFPQYGLTDLSIKEAASNDTLVLSADWPLIGMLRAGGIAALHYEEIVALQK
jgi:hypothetical protein